MLLVICMGYAARFWLPSRAKSRNIDLYRLQHRRVHRHPTGDGRDTPRSGGAEPTRIAGSGPGSSEIPPGTLSTAFRGRRHTLTSMWCISMLLILIQSGITPRQIAPRFVADSPLEGEGFEPSVPRLRMVSAVSDDGPHICCASDIGENDAIFS